MSSIQLNNNDLKKILPHRYPFLLIDRVLEVVPGPDPKKRIGREAKAIKNVTSAEPFAQGHFPENAIFPGVLMVEAMAQTGALACYLEGDDSSKVMIARINDARFRKPVTPGDTINLSAKVLKVRSHMLLLKCQAHVEGELVAESEIMAHIAGHLEV